MKKIILLLMLTVIGSFSGSKAFSQASNNLKLVIIRHGEKDASGDNLNCKGMNRALQIPKVIVGKFGVPKFIYVPTVNTGKSTTHSRMFQTATPLASKYGINVDSKYDVEDYEKLAANLQAQTGTILVVWEHEAIVEIAKALGAKTKGLQWPDNDFDSIWIVTYNNGKATLTMSKEGLNPAAACGF
jgi:hypothetical protein